MADPRETDTKWFQSAKNGDFENLLMLRFEDVLGRLFNRFFGKLGKTLFTHYSKFFINFMSRKIDLDSKNCRFCRLERLQYGGGDRPNFRPEYHC